MDHRAEGPLTRGGGLTQGGGGTRRDDEGITTGGEGLESVRAAVEEVVRLAVSPSPEVLDRTAVLLESAVAGFEAVRRGGQSGLGELRQLQELRQIRRAIQQAGALLRKAQQYHAGWGAYLGTRTGGYRAGGQPALLVRGRRFSVEG
jgi:hypothetical protein